MADLGLADGDDVATKNNHRHFLLQLPNFGAWGFLATSHTSHLRFSLL
jgi:hypothetical protein